MFEIRSVKQLLETNYFILNFTLKMLYIYIFILGCNLILLTPCSAKSNEYSLIKVVFPDPVGPVNIVSSPRRWPPIILFNAGNFVHFIPRAYKRKNVFFNFYISILM